MFCRPWLPYRKERQVSPENFDVELGKKIARSNARDKIWALEGYALRERLAS